jgi:hypothetical protein
MKVRVEALPEMGEVFFFSTTSNEPATAFHPRMNTGKFGIMEVADEKGDDQDTITAI